MVANCEFLESSGPLAIAHRGGAAEAEENTLGAFLHAAELGYAYQETDVCFFGDDIGLRVHHGNLRQWRNRAIDPGVTEDARNLLKLDDLLDTLPDARFFIDPKHGPAVKPLAEVIARTNTVGRVCIGAFSDERTRTAAHLIQQETGSRVSTAALTPRSIGRVLWSRYASA